MAKKSRLVTQQIGNLKGFSTASIFMRVSNIADKAINLQRSPDGSLQIRRGFQAETSGIGGLGNGSFDNPMTGMSNVVTLSTDGQLYNRLTKQIYFYYDGRKIGAVTGATNGNPCEITCVAHLLVTGTKIIIRGVAGMTNLNNNVYTITYINANTFSLDGVDSTLFPAFAGAGTWSIAFLDSAYLTYSIFTNTNYAVTGQSINGKVEENRAAQIDTSSGLSIIAASNANPCQITSTAHGLISGMKVTIQNVTGMTNLNGNTYTITWFNANNFTLNGVDSTLFPAYAGGGNWTLPLANTNFLPVAFFHRFKIGFIAEFVTTDGVVQKRTIVAVGPNWMQISGTPVTVTNLNFVSRIVEIFFYKGYEEPAPYNIFTFLFIISQLNPFTGISGLLIEANGLTNFPAAFLEILEPTIIYSTSRHTFDYWYWGAINRTVPVTFPGSANIINQNSADFENASFECVDDVIYGANGYDYPQKYDRQTVYRAGMPQGSRPTAVDNVAAIIKPFVGAEKYNYAITYTQIDNLLHTVEGSVSESYPHTVGIASATNVSVPNIQALSGWNTNCAVTSAALTTTPYGPDANGFYYNPVPVVAGYTLKIGDNGYYKNTIAATINGAQIGVFSINVLAGHGIKTFDYIYFNSTAAAADLIRKVTKSSPTMLEIQGDTPVNVTDAPPPQANILAYQTGEVFGNIAIVNGNQTNVFAITVVAGHTIQTLDVINFTDVDGNVLRKEVTLVVGNSLILDPFLNPVSVKDGSLIVSETMRATSINIKTDHINGITLEKDSPISNNLQIYIYRSKKGETLLNFIAAIPNNSFSAAPQVFLDDFADATLIYPYAKPVYAPDPPPISKYLRAYNNTLIYGGGATNNPYNSDKVFFSNEGFPESVPFGQNFFSIPNSPDDVTGIGVAGSTLIVFKSTGTFPVSGILSTGEYQVISLSPSLNIGCVAHATIQSVGPLLYFLSCNGVYAISENQFYPSDTFGNPVPLSLPIDVIFREIAFFPYNQYVSKRATSINYTKDNQYLLFLPCEDVRPTTTVINQSSVRYDARHINQNSFVLCFDYQGKNWFYWTGINAAGGFLDIDNDLHFQERRYAGNYGTLVALYRQHRKYRLVDHADHTAPQYAEWRSSWEDLGQPEVRKKFSRCVLLMDRYSELYQMNDPQLNFSSYVNRIPNLQNTIAQVSMTDNIRNSAWSFSPWSWNYWSGYHDTFVAINLRGGTVAKSLQVGFNVTGVNIDIALAGFQLEIIPENRTTVIR
jgi:hypothetical protein